MLAVPRPRSMAKRNNGGLGMARVACLRRREERKTRKSIVSTQPNRQFGGDTMKNGSMQKSIEFSEMAILTS